MTISNKRTDYILDDLFLDYSLPRDGRSFFETSLSTLGDKLANAMKSLFSTASDAVDKATNSAVNAAVGHATEGKVQVVVDSSAKPPDPHPTVPTAETPSGKFRPSTLVQNMKHTVEIFSSVIGELGHDTAIQTAAHVFKECLSVCKSLPPIIVKPADDMAKQARHLSFHQYIQKLLPRVRQLAPGTTMMVPAGWTKCDRFSSEEDYVSGSVILLVLHRRIDRPDEFIVSVCNSCGDQGLEYHPVKADGSGELRLVPLTLRGVKRERIINSAFWVMLMKFLLYPHPNNGPKDIYGSVLPSLSGVQIDANLTVYPEVMKSGAWLPPAEGGDKSGAICASFALFAILQMSGKSLLDAQWIAFVELRRQILQSVANIDRVSLSTRGLMLRSLAWHACRLKETSPDNFNTMVIEKFIDDSLAIPDPHKNVWLPPKLGTELTFDNSDTFFPLFDRVGMMEEIESQIGKPRPPKVLIPVPLATVKDRVESLADLRELWSKVVHCCALLQNQQSQIPHAQALAFGLTVHTITRVTPSVTSPWWDSVSMTEDTRMFLLRHLALIVGHFASSAFSLGGRAIDGGRIVTSCTLMALCDKLCRTISTDCPSVFALHYSGKAEGPVTAFGLGPGMLAEETACSLLLSPDLVTSRSNVLEYFESLSIPEADQLFKFDEKVDFQNAEFQLVEQLCLAMGMHGIIPESPYLITGEKKDLLTYFPELGWLRDIAFLSKILMNPDGEKLPQIKPGGYQLCDAELIFKFDKKVYVKGFGLKQLELCGGYKNSKAGGVVNRFRGIFFWKRGTGRVFPSMADPSNLCNGDVIASEDDVLHCKNLPKFDTLGRTSVERLVTLLTAPYLRIPLLVAFFRDREKVAALSEPRIQAVMDAALFEPGKWRTAYGVSKKDSLNPAEIKIPGEPSVLHSPWGLMYNELIYAPKNTIEGVIDLLDAAMERDAGRFGSPSSKVILYAVRLTCRVARFIAHILASPEKVCASLPLDAKIALESGLRIIRDKLSGQSWIALSKWSDRALRDNKISDACVLQAHVALVCICKSGGKIDWDNAGHVLASQAYLSMNHRWGSINAAASLKADEANGGTEKSLGGVYEFELLDVFASCRRSLFDLLEQNNDNVLDHPLKHSACMNTVVKLLTQGTSTATVGVAGNVPSMLPMSPNSETIATKRMWTSTSHLTGVYVPETEAPPDTFLVPLPKETYADWLLRVTKPLALTVNVNLGQFSLTDKQMGIIPEWAFEFEEYVELFGTSPLQVAEVKSTTHREWLRIVGHGHDVYKWTSKCERPPPSIGTRSIPGGHWVSEILFSTIHGLTAKQVLPQTLRIAEEIDDRICVLTGELKTEQGTTFRDIIVRRDIQSILIFDVIEYGRRWYRKLVWTSDEALAMSDCSGECARAIPGMVCGRVSLISSELDSLEDPPGNLETLVISRKIKKEIGEQFFIPSAYLRGILPDVLLSRYRFWQFGDGTLEGEWIPTDAEKTGPIIRVTFVESEGEGVYSTLKRGTAIVTRARSDRLIGNDILLNLSYIDDKSKIFGLSSVCRRLDNLSNILVWGNQETREIDEIEIPRLRLSFKRKGHRLVCQQHEGYWLLNEGETEFSHSFEKILQSLLGATAVLCSSSGNRAILVGSHIKPMRFGPGGHSVFARDPKIFGHFFYPAHLSEQFVTTQSLMSAVHLLRTRWMARQYAEAVDMIPCVFADNVDPQAISVLTNQPEINSDIHPDSYGLRLRLSLSILPFTTPAQLPWDLSSTMEAYLTRVRWCSANVRLSLDDEMYLLADVIADTGKKAILANRLMFLRGIAQGVPSVPCSLEMQSGDGWCTSGQVPANDAMIRICWPRLRSYTRPLVDMVGPSAIEFIIENTYPFSSDGLHPMLMVEMACRWYKLEIDSEDDSISTSWILNRLGAGGETGFFDGITHILRVLFSSPNLLPQIPVIPKKSALDILGNANYNWLKEIAKLAKSVPTGISDEPNGKPWIPEDSVLCPIMDWDAAPFVSDCSREIRKYTGEGAIEFGNRPLVSIVEKFVAISTGKERPDDLNHLESLLSDLERHQNANTDLGRQWISRVRTDVDRYVNQLAAEELYKPKNPLELLRDELQAQLKSDWSDMRDLMIRAVVLANAGGLRIAQQAGNDVEINFCHLIRMLMSNNGDGVLATVHKVRRNMASTISLNIDEIEAVMETVAHAMFRAVRVGQLLRCVALLPPKGQEESISDAQLTKLLREISARRFFCKPAPNSFDYDPRLLGAEFLFGVMFRETQINLLGKFVNTANCTTNNGPSAMVHQMIMGAGKTTVLAPLLGLVLSSPKRLVVSCVPSALLEFSREVMRERYSSPVLATPVITFEFNRMDTADEFMLRKLQTARSRRAVVVATPQTLKSVMLKLAELRYILIADDSVKQSAVIAATRKSKFLRKLVGAGKKMGLVKRGPKKLKEHERVAILKQIEVCINVLGIFRSGLVIMDEVDLLLHPLKSELRWPLGLKGPLDLTEPFGGKLNDEESVGMRWRIAWHLISALTEEPSNLPFQEISEARTCIEQINVAVKSLVSVHAVSESPHFVVLNRPAYHQSLMPLLTKWSIVFIRSRSIALQIPDTSLISFLEGHGSEEVTRVLTDREVKVVILFRQWLHILLPFVLSKKHRVEFGLLAKEWIIQGTPKSRRLLAVPFVGKDRPSPTSEFSHPEVLIGLTLISYRLNGLRREDLRDLIVSARDEMDDEAGKPFYSRKACIRWVKWIREAGGRVRGFSWAGISLTDIKERDNTGWREFPNGPLDETLMNSVWPLELVDTRDSEQMDKLFILLSRSMSATIHYLFECAFPEALDHTPSMLVSSGQELGGEILFGTRLGFSGTPNDLLPKPMGKCEYDEGCDGRIAATLTSPKVVVGLEVLEPNWTPMKLLEKVVNHASGGRAHALIDCGALVTNLTNFEVAEILLASLPASKFDAVVFISDNEDERLLIDRQTKKIIPFAQSGLPRHRCFTFYDQIHTTGIDIEQPLNCTAILTLNKDSTFRDFAQAAYRMRGLGDIGQQKLSLLITPQVNHMINSSSSSSTEDVVMPCRVLGWTIQNSLASELSQYMLLCQQNVENLWKSSAWDKLSVGTNHEECIDVLKEPIDYVIDTDLSNSDTRYAMMQKRLKSYSKWLNEKKMNLAVEILLDLERVSRSSVTAKEVAKSVGKLEMDSEQVQEQEQEEEQEQEQEQQQQMELEMELEVETVPEAPADQKYSREDESVKPWKLNILNDVLIPEKGGESSTNPFYPLKTFSIYSGILNKQIEPIDFPPCMLMSSNYFRPQWRLSSVKRLKNVIVILEYVPGDEKKQKIVAPSWLSDPLALLDEALLVLDLDAAPSLTADNIEDALDCLYLDRSLASPLHPSKILKGESSIPVADFKGIVTAWYLTKRMTEISKADEGEEVALHGINAMGQTLTGFDDPSRSLVAEAEPTRYFAIVTLSEAEYLRSAMHRLSNQDCPKFALRVPGLLQRPLDSSYPYARFRVPTNPVLPLMADQIARFVDCDPSGFTSAQITLLMKTLAPVPYALRKEWYLRNMQCRVRPNKPWQNLSVARLFVSPQEQAELQLEVALDRLKVSLATRSIDPKVLFSSWDINKRGRVSTMDVISGIQALQIGGLSSVDIQRIVRKAEGNIETGFVPLNGWLPLFPESMVSKDNDVYDNGFKVVSAEGDLLTELGGITDSHKLLFLMLPENHPDARYKVKLMPHDSVKKLWSSQGLSCPPLTVWEPTHLASGGGLLHARSHSVRERLCLGNLVTFNTDKQMTQCTVIEIRDMYANNPKKQQGETLEDFIELVFPKPTSYRLVWSEKTGSKPLYVWRPVARNDMFQAVGVVCTLTPQEPSVSMVRTIPRQWLAREQVDIRDRALQGVTWRDSGRRVWAQELLSTMDADKEGNSDLFAMWQILNPRFFLASYAHMKQQQQPQHAATAASPSMKPVEPRKGSPQDLLLDSPSGAKNLIPINATSITSGFSLLDSPTHRPQPAPPSQQAAPNNKTPPPFGDSLI